MNACEHGNRYDDDYCQECARRQTQEDMQQCDKELREQRYALRGVDPGAPK
jgi:hypothetical protein